MAYNLLEKIKDIFRPKDEEMTVIELENAGLTLYYKEKFQ